MELVPTGLDGVLRVQPTRREDERGQTRFAWVHSSWAAAGLPDRFVLENHLVSRRWVLRGIHRQMTQPQGKLVRCHAGRVFDVAVDLRPGSACFGRWYGTELAGEDGVGLWIPAGFGHGFLALTDDALVSIQADAPALAGDERALAWDDASLGVGWPLPAGVRPILSARDTAGEPLSAFR